MRHRAAAFGGAEVRGGGENGPISRCKSPSNGRPECSCDTSLAAKYEIQAGATYFKYLEVATSKGTCGQPGYRYHRLAVSMRRACSPGMGSRAASTSRSQHITD